MKKYKVLIQSNVIVKPFIVECNKPEQAVSMAYADWVSNSYEYGKQVILYDWDIDVQLISSEENLYRARRISDNGKIKIHSYGMHYKVQEV